jgi:hypothetical protein
MVYQSTLISTEFAPSDDGFALAVFPNSRRTIDASQEAPKWLAARTGSA